MEIRLAQESDLPQLLAIYNDEVEHGISTLDLHPRTLEERRAWFWAHHTDHHPLLVDVEQGEITGYASLSAYREKEAYRSSVELSIYVARAWRRQGVATRLMEAILERARADVQTHLVVSVITSGNEASEHLHRRFGFTYCGTVPEVGVKFARYQSIDNYYLIVNDEKSKTQGGT